VAAVPVRRGSLKTALVLFVALFGVYLSNLRLLSSGDNVPTRLLPFSIVREGNLDLDEFDWLRRPGTKKLPYYVHTRNGHVYSGTTIATPLLIAPLYIVADGILRTQGIDFNDVRARLMIVVMERVSAGLLVAISASLLYLLLARLVTAGWAVGLTLTYALGTSTWAVSSQGLWPHTFNELALVTLSFILFLPAPSRAAIALAGITAALAVVNRPQLLPFALLATLFVWRHQRRHFLAFIAVPVVAGACLTAYNLSIFRGLAGGYYGFNHFSTPLWTGVTGLLLSPNRGLLVFTPIAIFAFYGVIRVWRHNGVHPWFRYLTAGLAVHIVLYAKFDGWWGGYTYGPRYMTDVIPVLCLLLVPGLVPLCRGRAAVILASLLIAYGVAVQAVGVYWDDGRWNRFPVSIDVRPERAWDWSDWQVLRAARSGWKGNEMGRLLVQAVSDPTPARLEPLAPEDLAAELRLLAGPEHLSPGGQGEVVLAVRNAGSRAWPVFTGEVGVRYRVFLVVRWIAAGRIVMGAGDVLSLPENLSPGETVRMKFPLWAPRAAASYEVDMAITQALDGRHGMIGKDRARLTVVVN